MDDLLANGKIISMPGKEFERILFGREVSQQIS